MNVRRALRFLLLWSILGLMTNGASAGSSLAEAVARGDMTAVEALLRSGAAVDQRDAARRTPLLIATHMDRSDIARLLIDAGADVNAKDDIRDTPFLYAGAEGRDAILHMILATGRADLNDTNRYGGNALIPAAHHGHPTTVEILIDAGIALDHVNDLGWTALLETVILGDGGPVYQRIAALLVEAGADPSLTDRGGVTPLQHARARGYDEIARILQARR